MTQVRVIDAADVSPDLLETLRELCDDAFEDGGEGGFSDDDWAHAVGGRHVVAFSGPEVVAHAALVTRDLWVDGVLHPTGYVEAVATEPSLQGQGLGTLVMEAVGALITADGVLGALSTGAPEFYQRLGWELWRGPTYVRRGDDLVRTPDEDDAVMVLRPGAALQRLDLGAAIACCERAGDDW